MKCGPNIGSGCGGRGWNEKEKEKETEQGREREKKKTKWRTRENEQVIKGRTKRNETRVSANNRQWTAIAGFLLVRCFVCSFFFSCSFSFSFFFLFIPFDFGLALACRFIKSVRSCEIAGFIKKKKDQTQFYLVLPSLTEFCLVLQIFYRRFSWFLRAVTVFYLVLPSFTQFYPVLPSFTEI